MMRALKGPYRQGAVSYFRTWKIANHSTNAEPDIPAPRRVVHRWFLTSSVDTLSAHFSVLVTMNALVQRLPEYLRLMRFDRPVGTLLLLWPTLAAVWVAAAGTPPAHLVVIFALGCLVMRAAGCVINDYADRHLDVQVARTRDRPLARRSVDEIEALLLFAILLAVALLLVMFLNPLTQWMAVAGALIATLYPFMKRWTYLPQVVLGAAFSWGIVMAFTAVQNALPATAWLMFVASLLWIVMYDTLYAMVDRDDDLKAGIKSTAILFGQADRIMVAVLQMATLLSLTLFGLRAGLGLCFAVGLAVIGALFVHQQRLIRHRDRDLCLVAFKNNVWVGFVLWLAVVLDLEVVPALSGWAAA
jgi:4-hydroxybenzoate polyprenyltransferase